MNSVSSSGSNGSGGNGSGNESAGSAGSTRSRGSAGSGGRPEGSWQRRERQERARVVMVNTLMNMNIGEQGTRPGRSRNGGKPEERDPRTIDLGGKKKGLCGDDYFGPCSGRKKTMMRMGSSPGGSPNGTPCTGNTPRASAAHHAAGLKTPPPRVGAVHASAPRPSPRVSPRGSPPSPLAVVPPIKGEVLAVQGEVEGEVIKGSITRHVRTASEPMSLRGHEFPRAPPVKESKSSASVASSPARPRPKPQRKTSNSFSAIGRNLRALKG
ncbi:hypothetical protein DFP72DRAFT_886478, partial [Ephemerocybe angulata]